MSIEKSPLVREQEGKIAELQGQIKKKNTVIKSLKTRLDNMKNRAEEIQRTARRAFEESQRIMIDRMKTLKALMEKLSNDKRFSAAERAELKNVVGDIESEMPNENEMPEFEAPDPEFAEEKARSFDPFAEFKVAPDNDDQKDLRKLYLQLSKRFHPDRAKDETEKKRYHEIQQHVINAYQAHDLQAMVSLAMEHDLSLLDTAQTETDVLEQRIQFLTRQLEGLELQQERLSAEVKGLRKSDVGKVLTEVDGYDRMGVDIFDHDSTIGPALQQIDILISLLQEIDKTGNMDLLEEMFAHPFGDHYDPFGEDEDDFEQAMMDFFNASSKDNPHPRYPIGSAVTLTLHNHQTGQLLQINGTIIRAILVGPDIPSYDIEIATDSLTKLPLSFIEEMVEEGVLGRITNLNEEALTATKKPIRSSKLNRAKILKGIWRQIAFSDIPNELQTQIMTILDADPTKKDVENWLAYLNRKLSFPFPAVHVSLEEADFGGLAEVEEEITVHALLIDPEDNTLLAKTTASKRSSYQTFDLDEVHPTSTKYEQPLELYTEWYDAYVGYEGYEYGI